MDVSIIIPYNKDRGFLKHAVESAKGQKFTGAFEVILAKGDKPLPHNVNKGVEKATGKYIRFCAEDDRLDQNAIQQQFDFCEKNQLDWCVSNAMNVNNKNEAALHISKLGTHRQIAASNTIHGGSTMYRRDVFIEAGGYDVQLWTAEEYEFHLRLLQKGYKVAHLDYVTYYHYLHKQSKSYRSRKNHDRRKTEREKLITELKTKYRDWT